jgi:hypothetical protein
MGHMTYFIFEPPSPQPRDPADSKYFWAKITQHQITNYKKFDFVFAVDANMLHIEMCAECDFNT